MTLKEYFEEMGRGSLTMLAKRLDVSKGYLSDMSAGKKSCSVKMAKRIEAATEGAVGAIALLGLEAAK